jgi:hypothetical protein
MITIPHKATQFLVFMVKLLIVTAAFYFIYKQLTENPKLQWSQFQQLVSEKTSLFGVLFVLTFSFANRFLEIVKWQNLVTSLHPISLGEASKQVLGALTAGIFTPNGLGEYAGKALYFEKQNTKQIVFLNLVCNGVQMILTILFGIIGLFILGYWTWALGLIAATVGFLGLSLVTKTITIKGYSIEKLLHKINEIPRSIHQKNNFLGICRYLIFSHQTYFLFLAFNIHVPYPIMMATITTVYLLSSILPSFQFLDFAVKGSIAVFFFDKLGVNELVVVFITTLMWFLNVVVPVVIGSYFVLNFRPKWK